MGETPGLEAYKKSGIQEFIGFSAHALKHLKNSLESVWLVPQQAIVVKIPKSFKRLWMQHHARHAKIDQVQHHQCGKAPKGWGCDMVWHEDVAWKWKEMVAIIGYYYDVNLIRCKGELLLQTATPPTFLGACWLQCSTESSIGTKIRDRNLFHPKWFQKWITKQKQPNPIFLYQLLAVMTDEKTKSCIQIMWKISLCFEGLCIGFSEPAVLCKFGFCNRSLSRS